MTAPAATADLIEGIDVFMQHFGFLSLIVLLNTRYKMDEGREIGWGVEGVNQRQGLVNQTSRSQSQHRTNRSLDARWLCALQVVGKLRPPRRLQKWMLLNAVCSCLNMYTVACLICWKLKINNEYNYLISAPKS